MSQTSDALIKTVDVLLVAEQASVLLISRGKPPFENKLVMPGGHVEQGERLEIAASRELYEEVGILLSPIALKPLCILNAVDRDPRPGTRVSTVYWMEVNNFVLKIARPGSNIKRVHSIPLKSITPEMMGFDHYQAIEVLRRQF